MDYNTIAEDDLHTKASAKQTFRITFIKVKYYLINLPDARSVV